MSLETKLYDTLSGSTALVAVVSSAIYPEFRPQADALPAVVFVRSGGLRVNSLSGYSGLENAMVEVTVYATSVDKRREIGDAVIGAMSSSTSFKSVCQDSPTDFYDDEAQVYERAISFSVWNRE
jgi:hypothetical protein